MTPSDTHPTFEQSIQRLEDLVSKMESGDATLEESLQWFEEGMTLIKSCQTQLKDAEEKVQSLVFSNSTKSGAEDSE